MVREVKRNLGECAAEKPRVALKKGSGQMWRTQLRSTSNSGWKSHPEFGSFTVIRDLDKGNSGAGAGEPS